MVCMARFDCDHAFRYNSAGSEAIWMKNWGTLIILFAAGPGKGHIAVSHLSNYIEPYPSTAAICALRQITFTTCYLWTPT